MYITKKQLEKEIMDAATQMNNRDTQFKPFLFTIAVIGLVMTILFVIPILLIWLALWLIYMPLSILDSLLIKLWRRKYNG